MLPRLGRSANQDGVGRRSCGCIAVWRSVRHPSTTCSVGSRIRRGRRWRDVHFGGRALRMLSHVHRRCPGGNIRRNSYGRRVRSCGSRNWSGRSVRLWGTVNIGRLNVSRRGVSVSIAVGWVAVIPVIRVTEPERKADPRIVAAAPTVSIAAPPMSVATITVSAPTTAAMPAAPSVTTTTVSTGLRA
jgi:hypothetical protein